MPARSDYELIDFGGGARLERFGDRVVDRPHPGALGAREDSAAWQLADLRFDRERGWTGPGVGAGAWPFEPAGLRLELRPTDAGQVGLFPEHLAMLGWLRTRIDRRLAATGAPSILHLFAYTGLATLAMAAAGAEVTHVDASKPTVAWARRNAELSGQSGRPNRWIVDDAVAFTEREGRRGRTYAGIVLDPPSYGHGPGARPWRLADGLPRLLTACGGVLAPGGFLLLTAHTPGFEAGRLAQLLGAHLRAEPRDIDAGELGVAAADGRVLDLGAFARTTGGA
ncbi:MAG: class I SAM-dependent methyltransferase [Chloroflexi bacterium]|nr:class I SAM-dependent methyltransferase [Chloroflexota bacterium]